MIYRIIVVLWPDVVQCLAGEGPKKSSPQGFFEGLEEEESVQPTPFGILFIPAGTVQLF